jgi:hypothetical protein
MYTTYLIPVNNRPAWSNRGRDDEGRPESSNDCVAEALTAVRQHPGSHDFMIATLHSELG